LALVPGLELGLAPVLVLVPVLVPVLGLV